MISPCMTIKKGSIPDRTDIADEVLGNNGLDGDERVAFFSSLLCDRFKFIKGVEIGVDHGRFLFPLGSRISFNLEILYGVDPYRKFKSYRPYWTQEHWDELYYEVLQTSTVLTDDILIVRMTSEEAACVLPDDFNFVYIDAAHDYYNVLTDISLWEEKIVPGGIIAGHDYISKKKYAAVGKAVDHYAKEMGRELNNFKGNWYWEVCKNDKKNRDAQNEV